MFCQNRRNQTKRMMHNLKKSIKCEILAPAGSFECMKAAYQAGADAVYAGGEKFGARQTVNFEKDELIEAIHYSHIRGKQFYLTINTLLKERELEEELFDYLLSAYQAGLDAAIVQDMGVFLFLRHNFPELPVHASTQMNVTGAFQAKELKSLGVTRIVTARELSLEEISDIYRATGLEIECFVHGALCYSYSGQCLLSSMIGKRSGNRGCCAQPCRLAYDVITGKTYLNPPADDNRMKETCLNPELQKYILSPKDLCTLELIPDILEAGIFSLKIEGRMKKPEYVASVTAMYRKYVDLYYSRGKDCYKVDTRDIEYLKEIYNRGGFTGGYYRQHNGKEMISLKKPNHCGVTIGKIENIEKNTLYIKNKIPLNKGDVLSFDFNSDNIKRSSYCNYTLKENLKEGTRLSIYNKFQDGFTLKKSMLNSSDVFRIRNNCLIQKIEQKYMSDIQYPINGIAEFQEGMACLTVYSGDIKASASTYAVSKAKNSPLSKEEITKRLTKTGETEFYFQTLDVIYNDALFVPVKELNRIKRDAIQSLRQKILDNYKRKAPDNNIKAAVLQEITIKNKKSQPQKTCVQSLISVLVSTYEQFLCAVSSDIVQRIYIEISLFSYEEMSKMVEAAYNNSKKIFCALPYIFRTEAKKEFENNLSFYKSEYISGFVLRNLEEYFYIHSYNECFFHKDFIFDSEIYCYNKRTRSYLESLKPALIHYSNELNNDELENLEMENGELDIYGYIPVMLTANCIKKTINKCDKQSSREEYYLREHTGNVLKIINVCRFCYNVIYHPKPLSLLGDFITVCNLKPASFRLNFTFESKEEMEKILKIFTYNTKCNCGKYRDVEIFTRGHFRKGVL